MHRSRVTLTSLALVVILSMTVVFAGCGSSEDGSDTTSASGTTGTLTFETYTDPEYGFSFDYPAGWQVSPSAEVNVAGGSAPVAGVTVGDPDGAMIDGVGVDILMVRVYKLNAVIDATLKAQTLTELEQLVVGMQTEDPSLQMLQPLTETTVGALEGWYFTATFQWTDETPMMTTNYFVFDGNLEYQLIVQSTEEHWDADQEVFTTFAATFTPGGAAE